MESLGSLPRGSADARGAGGVVRGCQAFPVTGSTSSRGSSQASGIIREGFNPWDNVPDQPIVRWEYAFYAFCVISKVLIKQYDYTVHFVYYILPWHGII